jgi:hypothetical protein
MVSPFIEYQDTRLLLVKEGKKRSLLAAKAPCYAMKAKYSAAKLHSPFSPH